MARGRWRCSSRDHHKTAIQLVLEVRVLWLGRDPKERGGACPRKVIEKEAKGGLLEYSVIYTDRATNSMSTTFQKTMNQSHARKVLWIHSST